MKTSNKLLIALAALFFLIPITGLIVERKNYVDAKEWETRNLTPKKFDDKLEGNFGQALSAYHAISIADGKGLHFNITFINDAKYGVKVSDNLKGILTFNVDANGTLNVTVLKTPENSSYINLLAYTPMLNKISASAADGLSLPGKFDSLEVNVTQVKTLYFGDENTADQLTINADQVGELSLNGAKVNNLTLMLNNVSFKTSEVNYGNLNINARGESGIMFETEDNAKGIEIGNLVLTTTGKGNIDMQKVTARQVSGSLSDSTTVNMPVVYLRQLLK